MAKPRGFSSEMGFSFDRGSYRYALIPWTWYTNNPTNHWGLPASSVGGVDLRSLPNQAIAGGLPQGFAFAASMQAVAGGTEIAASPHMSECVATAGMRSAWQSATGFTPGGATLTDMLWDQLTTGSDPTGQSGPKPLMPETGGEIKLYVGGHSLVKSERFRWGIHPHTNRVRDVLRADFAEMWERTNGDDHCRRCLDATCEKYRIKDWKEFVPARLHAHVPGRLPHQTTITESFNQADSTTLGPDLTWTEVAGSWDTISNQVRIAAASGLVDDHARADSDLSSTDHYAQLQVVDLGGAAEINVLGASARFASAANTAYSAFARRDTDKIRLYKTVAGVETLISEVAITISLPELYKVECNGSTIKAYQAGVERLSASDSAITTGTRGGINGYYNNGATKPLGDLFEAADLAAAATRVGARSMRLPALGRTVA